MNGCRGAVGPVAPKRVDHLRVLSRAELELAAMWVIIVAKAAMGKVSRLSSVRDQKCLVQVREETIWSHDKKVSHIRFFR